MRIDKVFEQKLVDKLQVLIVETSNKPVNIREIMLRDFVTANFISFGQSYQIDTEIAKMGGDDFRNEEIKQVMLHIADEIYTNWKKEVVEHTVESGKLHGHKVDVENHQIKILLVKNV